MSDFFSEMLNVNLVQLSTALSSLCPGKERSREEDWLDATLSWDLESTLFTLGDETHRITYMIGGESINYDILFEILYSFPFFQAQFWTNQVTASIHD